MIGKTISHYKILEKLGEGGMGVVYKAEDTKLKRTVALKFLSPQVLGTEDDKTRFINEARSAAALNHPNICTVHEIDEYENQPFIAMECIEGESLKDRIRSGPLALDGALGIAIEIAEGLHEAHSKGIIHRDIKSANIMLTAAGRVKVMDFGLAKSLGGSQLTQSGTTIGTVTYMSPEQARGEPVDHRTDIWSTGVVLYEAITGRRPFPGDYDQAVIYSILNAEPAGIKTLRPEAPAEVEKAIRTAMAKAPEKRYQRIEDLAAELRSVREATRERAPAGRPDRQKRSIAVLPFVDMSPEKDQEYFCDGLAEELINALTHIKPLRVVARTSAFSFKGGTHDVREIGEKLNVDTVLEGSIRKAGDRLRITVQLVNVADGYHLWSEKYDRKLEDVFAIQDEISLTIVDRLRIELLGEEPSRLVKRGTEDLEAYELYMRGRFFWEKRGEGLRKAVEYFNRAIAKDPEYGHACAGLADSYTVLSFYGYMPSREAIPIARENALRALEIDDTLAEAHSAMGWIHQFYDWDSSSAEREFKRAIELSPACTHAYYWYSTTLLFTNRPHEALRQNEKAIEVDPLSIQAHTQYGWVLIGVSQYYGGPAKLEDATERLNRALELDPDYALAHWLLGYIHALRSEYDQAIAELQISVELSGRNPWMLSTLGNVYGMSGRTAEARAVLDELLKRSKSEYVQSLHMALAYLGVGECEEALDWLERSYEDRDMYLIVLAFVGKPITDAVRDDPRYKALMEKIRASTR
jgi:serine/threonine protein kinase/Flp pilus assembly protein TadD